MLKMLPVIAAFGLLLFTTEIQAADALDANAVNTPSKITDDADNTDVLKLQEIIVTATRGKTSLFDAPYSTGILNMRQIQTERMSRNMPEALQEEPGVMVQKTGHGMGSPYIRGLTGYHNLLLVDGIRINNSLFRSGPNQYWALIDVFSIEKMEIVRGGGSVLYGSDALGGVVNCLTRSAKLSSEDFINGRTVYRFASAEQSHTTRGEGFAGGKNISLLGGITYSSYGDLVCGKHVGLQPETGYEISFADLKALCRIADGQDITLGAYLAKQEDSPRTHTTKSIIPWRGTTVGTDEFRNFDQGRSLVYLRHHAKSKTGCVQESSITVSLQGMTEMEHRRKNGASSVSDTGFDVFTLGLQAEFTSKTSFGKLVYGLDYYRDSVGSGQTVRDFANGAVLSVRPRGTVADASHYDLGGIFIQDEKDLSDRFNLTLGARYNYAIVDAGQVDPDPADAYPFAPFREKYSALVGGARLKYKAYENINLIFGASQGFRAPNLSDTTSFESVRTSSVDVPTPGLEPEKSLCFDIGVKAKCAAVEGEIFAFHNMLSDFIRRVPTTYQGQEYADPPINFIRYYGRENFSNGFIRGIEAAWNCHLDNNWSLIGAYMYTIGEGDDLVNGSKTKTPLSRIAPQTLKLGFRWEGPDKNSFFEAFAIIADEQTHLSPDDITDTSRVVPGGTPGYVTYNMRGKVRLCKNAQLSAAVENIANTDYRMHGSGLNGPGTNVIISLEMTF